VQSNSTWDVNALSEIGIQQELDQNGILETADFLDMARGEILKKIKRNRLVAATAPKIQTFMDVYLKK